MKRIFLVSIFFFALVPITNGQFISKADSLRVMKAVDKVFESIENSSYTQFEKISDTEISCNFCEGTNDSELGPYVINRRIFFEQFLTSIKNFDNWKRATSSDEILLVKENNIRSDITVFFTTWTENEYSQGHEGAQLGLHFKNINGKYRFSGIETIP